jgi:hypothetical protein
VGRGEAASLSSDAPPERMRIRFPTCKIPAEKYRQQAMRVELVMARDQIKLHPRRFMRSVMSGENLAIYTSQFAPRHMIKGPRGPSSLDPN